MTKRTPAQIALLTLSAACVGLAIVPYGCDEPEQPDVARLEDGLERFRAADLDSLRRDVEIRLRERSDDAEALLLKARLARVDDDYYVSGFPSIEAVVETAPDHLEALGLLGFFHYDKGQLVAASEAFLKVLAVDPTRPSALAGLAAIDMDRGDLETAEVRLSTAVSASRQGDPMWLLWRGSLDLLQGNPALALERLDRAHRVDQQDVRIARKLAEVLRVTGDNPRAEQVLRAAMQRNPAHPEPPTDLAELRLLAGDPSGAVELLEPLRDELESGRSIALLGRAYLATERPTDAEVQLQRALRFGASDRGEIELLLARAAFLQDSPEEGRQALVRAKRLGATDAEVEAIRAEFDR
ncbi:MAG: tetratricopeptide repeat protein [Planctomycetota bacterium]